MKWYFDSRENQASLFRELEEWLGTPYKHLSSTKKVGVDCIQFVGGVFQAIGVVEVVTIPAFAKDWAFHTHDERLYKIFCKTSWVVEVPLKEVMNGDILLYRFGKSTSHAGIYFDKNVYQAIDTVGVHKLLYRDKRFYRRRQYNFRVIA